MRLVSSKSVHPGEKLGKSIYNDNGQTLLHAGTELSDGIIKRLIEKGIFYIYIEDERTEGIEIVDIVSDRTKRMAMNTIKEEFMNIAEGIRSEKVFLGDRLSVDFSNVVHNLLQDIKSNKESLALLSNVYTHDNYIFSHSLNVTVYTLGLATKLGYNGKQLLEIGMGALLHDVGKMAVPLDILKKPDKLTSEEYETVKIHPTAGFNMLRKIPNISLLTAHCAFQHHERINGTGYPQGLKQAEIHEYGQIIGIADVFDAVTSQRVYRKPMLPHEALELLYSGVGTLYDQDLVRLFAQTIVVYPIGLTVKLSDDRVGIVVKQNKQLSTHPVVRIISEAGVDLKETYDLDLQTHYNITIVETVSTSEDRIDIE